MFLRNSAARASLKYRIDLNCELVSEPDSAACQTKLHVFKFAGKISALIAAKSVL